jgi:hypothetical protein
MLLFLVLIAAPLAISVLWSTAESKFSPVTLPDDLCDKRPATVSLPRGGARLAGLPWALPDGARAVILGPGKTAGPLPVNREATHVHFLHTLKAGPAIKDWRGKEQKSIETGGPRPERPVVQTYLLDYADGSQVEALVRWQEQIEGLMRRTFIPTSRFIADMPWARVAWEGELDEDHDERPVIYAMEWPNPYPEKKISAIHIKRGEWDHGATYLFGILTEVRPAAGRVMYLAPDGDDDGPGSFEKPWATLHKAARALEAGDTIYLRDGIYVLRGIVSPHNSGTEGAWITYAGYPGEVPVVDCFDIRVEEPGDEIVVKNGSDHEVPLGRSGGFHIFDRSYIRVKGLQFHRAAYQAIGVDALPWWHSHHGDVQGSHHLEFLYNTTYRSVASGLGIWGVPGSECREIRVIGNRILNAFDPGLALETTDGGWHERRRERVQAERGGNDESLDLHNVWGFELGHNEVSWGAKEGIDCKGQVRHGDLHHNYCHDMFVIRGFGGGKVGIYLDSWIVDQCDIEVRSNVLQRCGTGIRVMNEGGSPHYDLRIHHNLCIDNYWVGIAIRGGKGDGYAHDIGVYNNTVWRNGFLAGSKGPGGGISIQTPTFQLRYVSIYNNICADNRDFALTYHETADLEHHHIALDHNLCYPQEPGPRIGEGTQLVPTVGEYAVLCEPGFLDAENYNFRLRADSPARAAGRETDESNRPADLGAFPQDSG